MDQRTDRQFWKVVWRLPPKQFRNDKLDEVQLPEMARSKASLKRKQHTVSTRGLFAFTLLGIELRTTYVPLKCCTTELYP